MSDEGTAVSAMGTSSGFDDVYREQRDRLIRLAYVIVRSDAVAEELVHDAFLRLHCHFDEVETPPAFLHTALVRLCLSWLRRARSERERLDRLGPSVTTVQPAPDLDDDLWHALARLRPERRTAIALRYYADLSHAAIAEHMGCPVVTARSHVHRGLRDLRREIR